MQSRRESIQILSSPSHITCKRTCCCRGHTTKKRKLYVNANFHINGYLYPTSIINFMIIFRKLQNYRFARRCGLSPCQGRGIISIFLVESVKNECSDAPLTTQKGIENAFFSMLKGEDDIYNVMSTIKRSGGGWGQNGCRQPKIGACLGTT